jgi:hypothetical protein
MVKNKKDKSNLKILKYQREYYKENKDKVRNKQKEWYKENKDKRIKEIKKYQKNTNYQNEKTEKQRRVRYIKRRTRLLYPLNNHFCEFCGAKAIEHHHNTIPIEIDKFNFVCHNCHLDKNIEFKKEVK